jgi:hypothetical protein
MIVLVKDYFDMEIIGKTIDDAAGEAFDKIGKYLTLIILQVLLSTDWPKKEILMLLNSINLNWKITIILSAELKLLCCISFRKR